MLSLVIEGGIVAANCAVAAVPYRNDFATRTSGTVKAPRTYEQAYFPGSVCRPYTASSYTESYPYADASAIQDGWALLKGYSSKNNVFTVSEGENPGLTLVGNNTDVRVVQSFDNEFTSGVLKIQADIYTPTAFTSKDQPMTWIYPVYREMLDLTTSSLSAPLGFGPGWMVESSGGLRYTRAYAWTRNANDATRYVHQTDANGDITPGNWYRYQFEIDLDNGTYSGTFADLGTGHPTPDSAVSSPRSFRFWVDKYETQLKFAKPRTAATGGVAGLMIRGYYVNPDTSDVTQQPSFDNFSLAWRAPGTDEFVTFYENDFSKRTYRKLCPAATGTCSYAITSQSHDEVFSGYVGAASTGKDVGTVLVPDYSEGARLSGQDDWRRTFGTCSADYVKTSGSGGGMARISMKKYGNNARSHAGQIVHRLGQTVSSGKVRLIGSLKTPDHWGYSTRQACFGLAGNDFADWPCSKTNAWDSYLVCGGGITGTANNNFYVAGSTDTKSCTRFDDTGNVRKKTRFYKFDIVADLDAKTYGMEVIDLGSSAKSMDSMDGDLIYTTNSVPLKNGFGVDSIVLTVSGVTNATALSSSTGTVLMDNIRVWKDWDPATTNGTLIYENDFDTRTRFGLTDERCALAKAIDRTDGEDGWIRRDVGSGAFVQGDDNPCAVLANCTGARSATVQDLWLGSKRPMGATMQADVRPPSCWTAANGAAAVVFGGDGYYQGNLNAASPYANEPAIAFGFSEGNLTANACGITEGARLMVSDGRLAEGNATYANDVAIDTTHWYRFKAEADFTTGLWRVSVYDQGSEPQAEDSPDGQEVYVFEKLQLPDLPKTGFSSVALAGQCIAGRETSQVDDPAVALFDNVIVNGNAAGTVILFR